MTPHIELRQAQESDRALAQEAHHAAYQEVVERQFGVWDESAQDRFFLAEWNPSKQEVIVVDGQSCGYWVVERRAADFHLRELVIHPRFQGRGVGTWLVRRLQREATAAGLPVRLGTFHTNRAAVLYRRLGFEEIGSTDTHVLMEWRPELGAAAS